MGSVGKNIVDVDVDQLVEMLNKALADEWLAFYQYWVGAKVISGPMSGYVAGELEEHAKEELMHAEMLVERILKLKGIPILDPKKWFDKTTCGYAVPDDFKVKSILKQNIGGEQCAIIAYKKILNFVREKDDVTFKMILKILEDEIEHEDDLERIFEQL